MPEFRLKLTPVDAYFFGGEKHDPVTEVSNYYVRSNYYPQQTALLGLLRYYLLLKNNCLTPKQSGKEQQAAELIGEKSFDVTAKDQSFGKIRKLSPLYLIHNDTPWNFCPLDHQYTIDKNGLLEKNGEHYRAKHGAMELHIESSKDHSRLKLAGSDASGNCVIYPRLQTGNEKGDNGESKENAFYKQVFYQLKPGWGFAIDVIIDLPLEEDCLFIPFGGERCTFKIELKKVKPADPVHFSRNIPAFYCISDCIVTPQVLESAMVVINTVIPFRNLQSQVKKTENYDAFGKASTGQHRSEFYNLMGRGSVLYFETAEKRDGAAGLFENEHYKNAGFNHIIKSS